MWCYTFYSVIVFNCVSDDANGMPFTDFKDQAIPSDIINLLHNLTCSEGLSTFEAVKCIRMSLVPQGYDPYPFRNGVEECLEDMLKSIVPTHPFRNTVSKYVSEGVDFATYLYIPEVDEGTGEAFHERECNVYASGWLWMPPD